MAELSARDRILDTAFRLFYAHGIKAVGVDRIIAESGVAKATLYKHFPAKDDLVLAYLERVDASWSGQLRTAAAAAGPDPADQLVGLFDALTEACVNDGYRGCAFINTAAESEAGTPIHERTVAHKRDVREWMHELAAEAHADDPDGLARSLSLLLDGGLASGSLDADLTTAAQAKAAAAMLVGMATRPHGVGQQQRPSPGARSAQPPRRSELGEHLIDPAEQGGRRQPM